MERWKSLKKKWTLKEAQKLGTLSVASMTLQEKAELAQFYYRQLNLRMNSFVKAFTVPYAFTKLVQDFDKISKSDKVSEDRRLLTLEQPVVISKGRSRELSVPFAAMENPSASLNYYITRMQAFFSAKTATVAGWREVAEAQDKALFGVDTTQVRRYKYETDENGKRHRKELYGAFFVSKPKYRLTDDERRKLWAVIDLAKDAGWLNKFGYSSDQAHRQIASLWQKGDIDINDIDKAYDQITDIIEGKKKLRTRYTDDMSAGSDSPFVLAEGGGNIDEWSYRQDLLGQDDTLLS